ncbi:hypothetical protein EG832_08300, partial [bacterium]|nr:hypothetical protein [bacterium]
MFETASFGGSRKAALYEDLFLSLERLGSEIDYQRYKNDPVAFGQDVLGETFTEEVQALMRSVHDYPITLARSANATGKTHGAARVAVWFNRCFPDSQVYVAAAPPESNLKKLLWGEISSIAEKHPKLFPDDTIRALFIGRSARSFIAGVSIPASGTMAQREAKFSGKHASHLLFIIDEGDAVPDEVYRGVESCMSGGFARLLVMFNPRSESGEVYRMERDGRANVVRLSAFGHPNVKTGADVIPGAVSRETTIRRINEWCRPLATNEPATGECFELPSFLIGQTAKSQRGTDYPLLKSGWYRIIEPAFSYMVLGEYPAQGNQQLISREWIAQARSRWDVYVSKHGELPPEGVCASVGLDVGEYGTDSNVFCSRYGGFVERLITWTGLDILQTADRAVQEFRHRKAGVIKVDATGVGSGVSPAIQRQGCTAIPVKVASSPTRRSELGEFAILRDQLWWSCREWLRTDPGAMLPPDELLMEELQVPTYIIEKGRIRVMRKDSMREVLR